MSPKCGDLSKKPRLLALLQCIAKGNENNAVALLWDVLAGVMLVGAFRVWVASALAVSYGVLKLVPVLWAGAGFGRDGWCAVWFYHCYYWNQTDSLLDAVGSADWWQGSIFAREGLFQLVHGVQTTNRIQGCAVWF